MDRNTAWRVVERVADAAAPATRGDHALENGLDLTLGIPVGARRDDPEVVRRASPVLDLDVHAVRCRAVPVEIVQGQAASRRRPLYVVARGSDRAVVLRPVYVGRKLALGGPDPGVRNFEGPLTPVLLDYGVQVSIDEGQKPRAHNAEEDDHYHRKGHRHTRLIIQKPSRSSHYLFLRSITVVSSWVPACPMPWFTTTFSLTSTMPTSPSFAGVPPLLSKKVKERPLPATFSTTGSPRFAELDVLTLRRVQGAVLHGLVPALVVSL